MTDILITGASGFIGAPLVAEIRSAGHEVFAAGRAQGDICEEATWAAFPDVDVVIHLAGKSFVPESWVNPAAFVRSNVQGTLGALEYCRTRGARLIYLSSYMYGQPERLPIPESAPVSAVKPYALTKKLAEEAAQFYVSGFKVPVTILRLFNVYGPGQSAQFLIPSIVQQARAGETIRVKDLEPRRDYVYVTDVLRAVVAALGSKQPGGVYNVGSGVSHSVAQVIAAIQRTWGTACPVISEGVRRPGEIMDTVADITRARQQLGWEPLFDLSQGIEDMRRRGGA